MVRAAIRDVHRRRSGNSIKIADSAGLLPDAAIRNVPPVVVDANTLLNDALYACRHENLPTTLVSAANTGVIRLFCARHVLEEVVEHYRRLADERRIPPEAFASLWNRQYAPLLRVIRIVPEGLLSQNEQKRIEKLRL
ncbi:MAG TPA: PIN domain-containing protein, partial [Gaiellaceae bacterium]|nr:PIN domain-containing protein [Gaiellaceae bacterium]